MPGKKSTKRLEAICINSIIEAYVKVVPTILETKDMKKARGLLEKLPCQLLCELFVNLMKCQSLRGMIRESDVNMMYRFLVAPVVQDVCLIPNHTDCDIQISIALLFHNYPVIDIKNLHPGDVLRDLVDAPGTSKISNLHLHEMPHNIAEMISSFPNLKKLWIQIEKQQQKEIDKSLLKDLVCYLEDKPMINNLHFLGFSISPKILLTLKKMKLITVLDLRRCEVLAKAAGLLLCELPELMEFGWSETEGQEDFALVDLYRCVRKCNKHGCCLQKLQKWIGHVGVNSLIKCDKSFFNLINTDPKGFVCPVAQVPDVTVEFLLDYPQIYHLGIVGSFGMVSKFDQTLVNDYQLKRILLFNGKLITELKVDTGKIDVGTVCSIPHLCPNLEDLFLAADLTEDNRAPQMYRDHLPVPTSFNTPAQLPKLHNLLYSLDHDDLFPSDAIFVAERVCLRKILTSAPSLKTVIIDMSKNAIDDELFASLLPEQMDKLELFTFQGRKLDLGNDSVTKILSRAPSLKRFGDLATWKMLSKNDVKELQAKAKESMWELEIHSMGYPDDCGAGIDTEELETWMNDHLNFQGECDLEEDSNDDYCDYSDFEGMDDDDDDDYDDEDENES